MAIRSYRDLNVWQISMDLVVAVYEMTRGFPTHERYGLASQVQRSAVSMPTNIAEGHGKDTTKQFLFHVSVALGSAAETETHLILAERLCYADKQTVTGLLELCDRVGKMLRNLQKRLKAKSE